MHPHVFGVSSYAVLAAAAVTVGVGATVCLGRRAGLSGRRFVALQIVLAVIALAGAWVWGRVEHVVDHPLLAARASDGGTLRYPGGLVVWLAGFVVLASRVCRPFSLAALGDLMAPGIGVAMAVMRVGCFLNGCCFGVVTELPWGVRFPRNSKPWSAQLLSALIPVTAGESLPVHPLQLYFGAWSLGVAAFVLWFAPRKRQDGQVLLLFFALHEGGKAVLELLRGPRLLPHLVIPSLLVGAAATALLLVRAIHRSRRRSPEGPS